MRVLGDRWQKISGAAASDASVLRALETFPAVVAAAHDSIHFFEQALTDVAEPHVVSLAIEAPAPGIAEADGVNLGTVLRAGAVHIAERGAGGERIVGRDAIERRAGHAPDIDADHLAEQRPQILRVVPAPRVAVTRAKVQKTNNIPVVCLARGMGASSSVIQRHP